MPDIWLDVDTAVIVPVNKAQLIDDTDFKTIETAVVYNSAGMALTWVFTTPAGAVTMTAVTPTTGGNYDWGEPLADKGMYTMEIPASGGASINNDTEGVGFFVGVCTGVLPWISPFIGFRRKALNDLLIAGSTASTNLEDFFDGTGYAGGTAKLAVDAVAISGDATAADNAELMFDGTGYAGGTIKFGVDLVAILGTAITETAGLIAAGFKKFFNVATPTGTVNSLPNAVAGAASGLTIVGSQVDLVNAPNATAVTAIQSGLATTTELNKVPKSDGTTTWNATALTAIQTQATGALNTYDPPTRAELTTDTNSILSKMLKRFQLLFRKDAAIATDNATELTEINADGGSGAGAYNNTTDSQEAIRDTAPLGTAMRGTDNALLTTNYTAPDNAGITANGVAIGALNNLSSAQAQTAAAAALTAYDPPTRTEATTDTNSILSKLLKYIQLVLRKDAAIATDNATEVTAINANGGSGAGGFANTTDSQEAIRDNQTASSAPTAAENADAVFDELLAGHVIAGSAGAALSAAGAAADPLASAVPGTYVAGTAGNILGQLGAGTPAVTVTSGISSGNIAIVIGSTFTGTFSGLTISASWSKIYLTIKDSLAKTDAQSIIQIVETATPAVTDGLLYLNAAAGTAAQASLTVSQAAGTIAVSIADDATVLLSAQSSLHYDLKAILSDGTSVVLGSGYCNISQTPTLTI